MNLGINNSKKEHRVKGRQYLTMMFITDATKDPKSIRIPKWLRYPLLALVVLIVWSSLSLYEYIVRLESQAVNSALIAQEATMITETKDRTIAQLEEELNTAKETRYDQLVELQQLAVELGTRLEELEGYRDDMQEFKKEIDTSLSTSEDEDLDEEPEEDVAESREEEMLELVHDDGFLPSAYRLGINPEAGGLPFSMASIGSASIPDDMMETPLFDEAVVAPDVQSIDIEDDYTTLNFDAEVAKINRYLGYTIEEIDADADSYMQTADALEEIIPYVKAYPGIFPVENTYVTSSFGYRRNPFGGYTKEFHSGVDLKARYVSIMATGAGTVIESKYLTGFGYTVMIDHGYGLVTKYSHNSKLYVKVGEEVERGDIIAKSGNTGRSTGPHLHYEVIVDGVPQNPVDFVLDNEEID